MERDESAIYCSDQCRKNATEYRRYHSSPEFRLKKALRSSAYMREWREKKAAEGSCIRCGRPNDRSTSTCSSCQERIDHGPNRGHRE